MFADRVRGWCIKTRGVLAWCWPFLLALAVTGNLVVLPILVVRQAESLQDTRRVARLAKESADANRVLILRGNPCVTGDDPNSEACLAERVADERLAEALAAVQAQHDQQARNLDDAVARLIELQERQHGVGK